MAKDIKIIGAGIAGLSAGCYLQMNGYDTEIYEMSSSPGGLCCAWQRKGYTIEGCIHWLVGSSPTDNFYHLWNEVIDMKKLKFFDHTEYISIEDGKGGHITVYTDIDRFEKEMLSKALEDEKPIKEFTKAVRKFSRVKMPVDKAQELYNLGDAARMMIKFAPYLLDMKKWMKITAGEYAKRFKNELLRKTFEFLFLPEMSTFFLVMTLAWMTKKSAGYPIGGSFKFARLIEKRYRDLGGKINYKSKVVKIKTDKNAVVGIVLENGKEIKADTVISAADGYCTIFEMLDGKYLDKKTKKMYDEPFLFPSYLQVSLGIGKKFENISPIIIFPLDKPILIDETAREAHLSVRFFDMDPTLTPKGKTLATVVLPTRNYKYWVELRKKDRNKYSAEKARVANQVIEALDKRFGDLKARIEMVDVSTPATVIRYTNNWQGSLEGWLLTPKIGLKQLPNTLPGLDNFYMAGQWVVPGGGLPTALFSGRNVTQLICKRDKKKFVTETF